MATSCALSSNTPLQNVMCASYLYPVGVLFDSTLLTAGAVPRCAIWNPLKAGTQEQGSRKPAKALPLWADVATPGRPHDGLRGQAQCQLTANHSNRYSCSQCDYWRYEKHPLPLALQVVAAG